MSSSELPAAVPCQQYRADDQCFTYFYNNVATRGCLSENENLQAPCEDELLCSKCVGDGCNGKTIEEETCIFCDSELDSNCVSNITETMQQTCPTSAGGMGCYRFDDGGKYMSIFFLIWVFHSFCHTVGRLVELNIYEFLLCGSEGFALITNLNLINVDLEPITSPLRNFK